MVIDNNHCKFVYNNINLEKEKKTFCDYCNKSFAKIKSHKCKRSKCVNCLKFTKMLTNENKEIICKSKVIKNDNYTCDHCKKTIDRVLREVDGVEDIKIDLAQKQVEIVGAAIETDILSAIEGQGYTVEK